MDVSRGTIVIANPKAPQEAARTFTYDAVYDWKQVIVCLHSFTVSFVFCCFFSSKQIDLYEETFRDLVDSVLSGFNGTIFAYGQTGTGTTFTMQGQIPVLNFI